MRYKLTWKGPWDSARRAARILTMQAKSKAEAVKLLGNLFPILTVKCVQARRRGK